MQPKLLAFLLIIGLGSGCVIDAQETSPTASPSPAKHRWHKKAETAATSPAAEASPSPAAEAAATASPAEKKHGPKPKPEASPAATAAETANEGVTRTTPEPGGGRGTVWVNTVTHIYHKEGSRFYGKTKKGKYMTEAEAIKEGDKEAKKETGAKPR